MYKESNQLELKREYTKSFLKTVSAFANERDGRIIFGIDDGGNIVGVSDEVEIRQRIENAINDNIHPRPEFKLETKIDEDKQIVILTVLRGRAIPYLYQNKPYMRNDTSTSVADEFRLRRWYQEISDEDFDEKIVDDQGLTFEQLAKAFEIELGVKTFTDDTLVTLGLKRSGKFTNSGRFFADENRFNFGVDIVKFGKNRSEFIRRERLTNQSLLTQYQEAMAMFDQYYHDYEVVTKGERVTRTRLPREAFRESLANAIVHRDYQVKGNIQIEFWDDHIRVVSPGGLTSQMTPESYLEGNVSIPRNETIANIFFRLKLIETFGTGIERVKQSYLEFEQEPTFKVSTTFIEVNLPTIDYSKQQVADDREEKILTLLVEGPKSRSYINKELGFGPTWTLKLLTTLLEQGKIERIGAGPSTKYQKVK
jgi:ATP-dependent DNA helicase RecG